MVIYVSFFEYKIVYCETVLEQGDEFLFSDIFLFYVTRYVGVYT